MARRSKVEIAFDVETGRDFLAIDTDAPEREATPAERETLMAAGWRETVIKILWIPPAGAGGGLRSVDEALAEIEPAPVCVARFADELGAMLGMGGAA